MKKNIIFTLVALVAIASSFTSCNKIVSMDNIRGYEVVADNRYEVLDMDDNREPLSEAITLSVPDTIGRQGTAGVVPGTLTADISVGAGFVEDFSFTYNNGEKTFSYSVAGDFALEYDGNTVWPIHGFTLTGEFSVVSERTTPTYLQISKVEWTLRAENGAIAAQKASYHKIYEDPKDSVIVVVHDTVWQHVVDTVFVWQHDTVIRVIYDTVVVQGDTTNYMYYVMKNHKSWDGINGGYVLGTDSVKLVKMDANHNVLSTSRGTYQHRTHITYNVPTMTSAVAGNCYNFVNGTASCAGTNATCTLGATQVMGPVVLGGVDITACLQGCQPYAQRICYSELNGTNGTYTIYIVGHDGEDAGTITGNYTVNGTNPPTPGYDTINVPGTVLFAGVTLSLQDPVNGQVTPEYYLVIEYQKANGQIWRMRRPETSTGNFTNVQLHNSVTASTISSNLAAGKYPAYCYRYNNGSNTEGYVYHVTEGNAWATIWVAYDNSLNAGGMFTNANSTSNIFYGNGNPAIEKGYRTTNGTLTVNGTVYYIQGN